MIETGSVRRVLDRAGVAEGAADDLLPRLFLLAALSFAGREQRGQWRSAMFVATDMESNCNER